MLSDTKSLLGQEEKEDRVCNDICDALKLSYTQVCKRSVSELRPN